MGSRPSPLRSTGNPVPDDGVRNHPTEEVA